MQTSKLLTQGVGLLGDQSRALGSHARGDAFGGAAMGALRGLRGIPGSSLPKKTEKTVAAARELNGFLQGFIEQVKKARDKPQFLSTTDGLELGVKKIPSSADQC